MNDSANRTENETEKKLDTICGKVEKVFYHSDANRWTSGLLKDHSSRKKVKFVGYFDEMNPGEEWQLQGTWKNDPKFGPQLEVLVSEKKEEDPYKEVIRLFRNNVDGIGEQKASEIARALGGRGVRTILEDPDFLERECGFTSKLAAETRTQLQDLDSQYGDSFALLQLGLNQKEIDQIVNSKFRLDDLRRDPFLPYYKLRGFTIRGGMKLADGFHLDIDDPRRAEARIWQQMQQECYSNGSTYITLDYIIRKYPFSEEVLMKAVESLAKREVIVFEDERVYPSGLYHAEETISRKLDVLCHEVPAIPEGQLSDLISKAEKKANIRYDETQKRALKNFFASSVMILNGGPGTGKSTVVLGMLNILKGIFPDAAVKLCAPTGRAAKRLSETSGQRASTIHSLLKWNPETDVFPETCDNLAGCDFLIIDEFSMVDERLFAALLRVVPTTCRLLLIGDEEQLESVGSGKVLNDLIDSGCIPLSNLRVLHRQKQGDGIAILCDRIRNMQPLNYDNPVKFIPSQTPLQTVEQLIAQIDDPASMQFLSARYDTENGIHAINKLMQEKVNPFSPGKAQLMDTIKKEDQERQVVYRVGDRVLITSNMYDHNVFNGDIGTVTEVNVRDSVITIQVDDNVFEADKEMRRDKITHGWCISVHKSQGSEYQRACVIVDPAAAYMLTKKLLYTAVSRAKKELYIIGDRMQFETACRRPSQHSRRTGLREKIEETFQSH